jgi:hypothetical protein
MKIAYLMNGVIGGLVGKNYEGSESLIKDKIVKYISNTHSFIQKGVEIDYFIFSWEPELEENNIEYDLVINARLDLCFTREINLSQFNPSKFHLAYAVNLPSYNWPRNSEMIDHIFISNPEYMFKFMEMFTLLNNYTLPGQCPQWKLISNHFLVVWHLDKLNLLKKEIVTDELLKTFDGGYDSTADVDYYIFRYRKLNLADINKLIIN